MEISKFPKQKSQCDSLISLGIRKKLEITVFPSFSKLATLPNIYLIYTNKIRGWSLKSIAIILNLMFENYKLDKTILIKSILKNKCLSKLLNLHYFLDSLKKYLYNFICIFYSPFMQKLDYLIWFFLTVSSSFFIISTVKSTKWMIFLFLLYQYLLRLNIRWIE